MTLSQQQDFNAMKSQFLQLFNDHSDSYQLSEVLKLKAFLKIINSPRDYSTIKRIEDLIGLLERRNAISVSNVGPLAQICGLIIVQDLDNGTGSASSDLWKREAQTLVNDYKKKILLSNCEFCGLKKDNNHTPQEIKSETRNINRSPLEIIEKQTEIVVAQNSSNSFNASIGYKWWERVGVYCDWNVLRRLPGLTEKDLNNFREKYSDEYGCQQKVFEYWLQTGREHVKIEALVKALTEIGNPDAVKILLGIN